jgi:hypothetical protein
LKEGYEVCNQGDNFTILFMEVAYRNAEEKESEEDEELFKLMHKELLCVRIPLEFNYSLY